jgi:hypothetical protein
MNWLKKQSYFFFFVNFDRRVKNNFFFGIAGD